MSHATMYVREIGMGIVAFYKLKLTKLCFADAFDALYGGKL